jgi:hypothetical protein
MMSVLPAVARSVDHDGVSHVEDHAAVGAEDLLLDSALQQGAAQDAGVVRVCHRCSGLLYRGRLARCGCAGRVRLAGTCWQSVDPAAE